MKFQEYANGVAYTYKGLTILFPFGVSPKMLFGPTPCRIDNPEQFGTWETPAERRKFVRSFHEARVVSAK